MALPKENEPMRLQSSRVAEAPMDPSVVIRQAFHDGDTPIDLVHLAKQTMGDKDLEVELLRLFARQAKSVVATLSGMEGPRGGDKTRGSGELLHMLCGSARAVGSWAVAAEAHKLEGEVGRAGQPDVDRFASLGQRVDRACAVIDDLLQGRD